MRRDVGTAVLVAALSCAQAPLADTFLSMRAGEQVLEIPASGLAAMEISESGGITDVFLRLMPGTADDLASLVSGAAGDAPELRACGVTLMAPVIRGPADSGTIYLAGTTMVRAEAIRALWHGRASCDTLSPEVFGEAFGHGQ